MRYYISIDIGGTSIKYGLLDEEGRILEKSSMDTEAQRGAAAILEKAGQIIDLYREKQEISGICISTAGMVDCEKGEIFYSGELIPHYTGTQFKKVLEETYGIPCEVENDVNCAGLAEYKNGAASGSRVAVCLTLGTGIGGCILIDGKVFHGFSSSACEIGYMNMYGSDFQTLGASSILSKNVAEKKQEDPKAWPGIRIFEEAGRGDAACIAAIEQMAEILGEGIANICYVMNPEVVVLGGGIAAQEAYLKPLVTDQLRRFLKPVIFEKTRLEFAKQRNDAGMLGAFYHFQMRRQECS